MSRKINTCEGCGKDVPNAMFCHECRPSRAKEGYVWRDHAETSDAKYRAAFGGEPENMESWSRLMSQGSTDKG